MRAPGARAAPRLLVGDLALLGWLLLALAIGFLHHPASERASAFFSVSTRLDLGSAGRGGGGGGEGRREKEGRKEEGEEGETHRSNSLRSSSSSLGCTAFKMAPVKKMALARCMRISSVTSGDSLVRTVRRGFGQRCSEQ